MSQSGCAPLPRALAFAVKSADPKVQISTSIDLAHVSLLLTAAEVKEESPEPPRLGELTVTGVTPDSLRLSWTVARGPFDSFVVLYKDAQGQPQSVPIEGDENEVTIPGLESNRKYKMNLYGLRGRQRVGPVSVVAKTGESEPHTAPFTAGSTPHAGPAPAPPFPSASASFVSASSSVPTSQGSSDGFRIHVPHSERLDPSSTLHPPQTPSPSATVYCGLH